MNTLIYFCSIYISLWQCDRWSSIKDFGFQILIVQTKVNVILLGDGYEGKGINMIF